MQQYNKTFKEESSKNSDKSFKKKDEFKETFVSRIFRKIIDSGIPSQKCLKVVFIGYTFGIVLTIIWYNFISNVEVSTLRWTSFVFMGYIVLILFYSKEVRCTATVAIPILCSAKGRSVIIAFAFFLSATGPTMNIIHNIDIMVTSLSCGQMQLKQALSDVLDTIKKPLVAIKEAIRNVIKDLKQVLYKVQALLFKIKESIMIILAGIKNAFNWLENVVKICNTEFGTPYERCMNVSKIAMQDCFDKLGPIGGLCHLTNIFSMVCYTAKIVDVICILVEFVNYSIIATVIAGLEDFVKEIKKLFDVSISFEHDFYFQTTYSKELEQVKKDIMADVHNKMKIFLLIFGWLDIVSLLLFILIIIKAIYFRLKYIRNPGYQNYYITYEFLEIDEQRKTLQLETVLPLTYLESLQYPGLHDCRLTKNEWLGIARSSVFLIISSIQLFCICFADYCLFWILAIISFYGHKELGQEVPPFITVEVDGGGFVAEIFRGIVHAFEPLSQNYTVDSKTCLPNPRIPNYTNYYLIGMIDLLAWIFLFCQPYGLRLRHTIMRLFYPKVARQRATWLYNKILLLRISFFKLARRKARLLFSKNSTEEFSFLDWLRARTDQFCLCRFLLGHRSRDKCILCSTPLDKDSSDDPDAVHMDETDEYCV